MRFLTGIAFVMIGIVFWNCSQTKVVEESSPPPDPKDLMSEFKVDEEMAEDFEIPEQVKEEDREAIATSKITTIDKSPVVLAKSKKHKKSVTPTPSVQPSPSTPQVLADDKLGVGQEQTGNKKKEVRGKKIGLQSSLVKEGCCSLPEEYPPDYNPLYIDYDKESLSTWKQLKPQIYIGEIFTFAIKYFGINCATIYLRTLPVVQLKGKKAYHFYANIKSAKFYEYFYTVDDYVETYVDVNDFFPMRYTLIQRESKQKVDDLQLFSKEKLKGHFWYKRVKGEQISSSKDEAFVPRFLLDSVSPLFFFRGIPLKVGDRFNVPISTRGTVWILTMNVVAKETLKIRQRIVPALKIQAETHFPGVLKKRGDIFFWYSDDDMRRPLKFEAKVKIGKIEGELINYTDGTLLQ